MTSKPASRSARATSLAPRSWPSSPGLATRTRTGEAIRTPSHSKYDRLLELAPLVLEHADHLADGAVRLGAVDQEGHEVLAVLGGGRREGAERGLHVGGRPGALDLGQPFELADAALLVELVALGLGRLLVGLELVHADNCALAGPHGTLDAESRLGDHPLQ